MNTYKFFWGGVFSQWFKSDFTDDNGITYNCAEQYMMAAKARLFNDLETEEKILKTKNPREQKALGRQVKNFDPIVWEKHAYDIVVKGNFYKFSQRDILKRGIIFTKEKHFVEASPFDRVWGVGMSENDPNIHDETKWKGQNLLGKALDEVRKRILDMEKTSSPTI